MPKVRSGPNRQYIRFTLPRYVGSLQLRQVKHELFYSILYAPAKLTKFPLIETEYMSGREVSLLGKNWEKRAGLDCHYKQQC